jgi:hypothetical protein
LRMPSRARVPFMRFTSRVRSLTSVKIPNCQYVGVWLRMLDEMW